MEVNGASVVVTVIIGEELICGGTFDEAMVAWEDTVFCGATTDVILVWEGIAVVGLVWELTVDVMVIWWDVNDVMVVWEETPDLLVGVREAVEVMLARRETVGVMAVWGETVDEIVVWGETVDVMVVWGETVDVMVVWGETVDVIFVKGKTLDVMVVGGEISDAILVWVEEVDVIVVLGETFDRVENSAKGVDKMVKGNGVVDLKMALKLVDWEKTASVGSSGIPVWRRSLDLVVSCEESRFGLVAMLDASIIAKDSSFVCFLDKNGTEVPLDNNVVSVGIEVEVTPNVLVDDRAVNKNNSAERFVTRSTTLCCFKMQICSLWSSSLKENIVKEFRALEICNIKSFFFIFNDKKFGLKLNFKTINWNNSGTKKIFLIYLLIKG